MESQMFVVSSGRDETLLILQGDTERPDGAETRERQVQMKDLPQNTERETDHQVDQIEQVDQVGQVDQVDQVD